MKGSVRDMKKIMKRTMRELGFLFLVMVLVMGTIMTVTAADLKAATTYTVTITDTRPNHTYEAYQIFAGELSDDEDTLSNISWGSGVTEDAADTFGSASDKAHSLKVTADAQEFANEIADYLVANTSEKVVKSTSKQVDDIYVYTLSGLEPGYYLIKDADGSLNEKDDSYTSYLMKIVKSQNITTKADMSEVQKKVKDINDSDAAGMTGWQDSADFDIGDTVPFQLKAKLAHNVSSYQKYKVVFHDTMSSGLTYDGDGTVTIKIDGKEVTDSFTITSAPTEDGGKYLTFSCDDVKVLGATGDSEITVEYTATLNEDAKIGAAGNPNEVYLEYSNNPNQSFEGENPEEPETGKTPEDVVIVFTYKVVINKVDKDNKPLAGATFKLEKIVKDEVGGASHKEVVGEYTLPEDGKGTEVTFSFEGLDDGEYVLTETNTPDGYNTMKPVTFLVTANHDVDSDEPKLTSLSGNPISGAIELTAGTNDDTTLSGELSADVVNYKGAELPETGGMGTTLFYVVGAILVIGAGVVLVTRRRMSK